MAAIATQAAQLYVLALEVHGVETKAGVMLLDRANNALHVRLRRDWDQIAPDEAEVLAEVEDDLAAKSSEMGAAELVTHLEDTLSNTLRISAPREVIVEAGANGWARALARQYRQHVETKPQPYVTHLPRYTLAVAAGKFLENEEIEEEGWEETPAGLRLTNNMFVARIVGRSMEPRIPDGSLCVFRAGVSGSRQGKLVLVEHLGGGTNDRYTVKRYVGEKTRLPDDTWTHERIRLEPLNPEYEAWDLDPQEDRFRVLAEFVDVLY
jgi:SOS-response transcriptional repressor LexA